MHSVLHQCQMNSQSRLQLQLRSDMDNPQVYIRHKDVRPSSHQKNNFFSKKKIEEKKICWKKKCYPLSFPILGGRDSTRALQSTPFQNPGGVVRAWRTKKNEERRKSLCLILIHIRNFFLFICGDTLLPLTTKSGKLRLILEPFSNISFDFHACQ